VKFILGVFLILVCGICSAAIVTIEFGGSLVHTFDGELIEIPDTYVEGLLQYETTTPSLGNEATYDTVFSQQYWINNNPIVAIGSQGVIIRNDYVLGSGSSFPFSDTLIHRADLSGSYIGADLLIATLSIGNVSYGSPSSLFSGLDLPESIDDFYGAGAALSITFNDTSGAFPNNAGAGVITIDSNGISGSAFDYLVVNGVSAQVIDGLITPVPIPAAAWLFGTALVGLGWMRRSA